mmetsp:Transcript_25151/g.64778  ORF Transcript_25151/g.64778 Transcript_25151/m.64778 type:complete len:248 (-) Transcript_25151:134-877(-)
MGPVCGAVVRPYQRGDDQHGRVFEQPGEHLRHAGRPRGSDRCQCRRQPGQAAQAAVLGCAQLRGRGPHRRRQCRAERRRGGGPRGHPRVCHAVRTGNAGMGAGIGGSDAGTATGVRRADDRESGGTSDYPRAHTPPSASAGAECAADAAPAAAGTNADADAGAVERPGYRADRGVRGGRTRAAAARRRRRVVLRLERLPVLREGRQGAGGRPPVGKRVGKSQPADGDRPHAPLPPRAAHPHGLQPRV